MAILVKKTDSKTKIEEIWYESSNIYYTRVDLSKSDNKILHEAPGITFNVPTIDVVVVFNRGAQYLYKEVEIHDYISFIEILDRENNNSHGKAFIKFIKPYPFEKLQDVDINRELQVPQTEFQEKVDHCYNMMINGNVTDEELIEWFGQEVFDIAHEKELEYIKNLN
ncbi:MAG: hypothetical protein FWC41_13060 [Firmicutes bacterium]|nr:hypothetical protein [Bacillota bacterium]